MATRSKELNRDSQLLIRITSKRKSEFQQIASEQGKTVTSLLNELIYNYVQSYKKSHKSAGSYERVRE